LEAAIPSTRANSRSNRPLEQGGLVDYCWRPRCRAEFRRTGGPGRRQEYCSEVCRRAAERELRQARSQLAHFEDVVQKLRIDVAAFGRPDSDEDGDDRPSLALDGRRAAEDAVRRAAGVLEFANPDEPAVRELRRLYEAVAPVILHDARAG
jgi:ADP-ribose pyrophosphatase YjhB (NUDIX family)